MPRSYIGVALRNPGMTTPLICLMFGGSIIPVSRQNEDYVSHEKRRKL